MEICRIGMENALSYRDASSNFGYLVCDILEIHPSASAAFFVKHLCLIFGRNIAPLAVRSMDLLVPLLFECFPTLERVTISLLERRKRHGQSDCIRSTFVQGRDYKAGVDRLLRAMYLDDRGSWTTYPAVCYRY